MTCCARMAYYVALRQQGISANSGSYFTSIGSAILWLRSDSLFGTVQGRQWTACHVPVVMGTSGTRPERATRRLSTWANLAHGLRLPPGLYQTAERLLQKDPFWKSFCKEHTQFASPPIRMGGEVIRVCSWPCSWAAGTWRAMTDCAALWGGVSGCL